MHDELAARRAVGDRRLDDAAVEEQRIARRGAPHVDGGRRAVNRDGEMAFARAIDLDRDFVRAPLRFDLEHHVSRAPRRAVPRAASCWM
jgi:hypothetical protein